MEKKSKVDKGIAELNKYIKSLQPEEELQDIKIETIWTDTLPILTTIVWTDILPTWAVTRLKVEMKQAKLNYLNKILESKVDNILNDLFKNRILTQGDFKLLIDFILILKNNINTRDLLQYFKFEELTSALHNELDNVSTCRFVLDTDIDDMPF